MKKLTLCLSCCFLSLTACNGGKTYIESSNPSDVRQNDLTISASLDLPYNKNSTNNYTLLLSNNTNQQLKLVSNTLNFSSNGFKSLAQLIKLDDCATIAPKSKCNLAVTLPETESANGSFNFKLKYSGSDISRSYEVSKLVKFRADLLAVNGIVYAQENEQTFIENSDKFILAMPFRLEKDFKDVKIEVDGKAPYGFNTINCREANFNAGNTCTALVELETKKSAPKLSLKTIDSGNNENVHLATINYTYNNYAQLSFSNAPLVFPNTALEATVDVVNTGVAPAENLNFSFIDSTRYTLVTGSCIGLTRLEAGDTCQLVYSNKNNVPLTPKTAYNVAQNVTYSNGKRGVGFIEDSFMLYRVPNSYVQIKPENTIPSIPYNGSIDVKLELIGGNNLQDGEVIHLYPSLEMPNPFGQTGVNIANSTCSDIVADGLILTKKSGPCSITLTPINNGAPTGILPTAVGNIKIAADIKNKNDTTGKVDIFPVLDKIAYKFNNSTAANVLVKTDLPAQISIETPNVYSITAYLDNGEVALQDQQFTLETIGKHPDIVNIMNNFCIISVGNNSCSFFVQIGLFDYTKDNTSLNAKFKVTQKNLSALHVLAGGSKELNANYKTISPTLIIGSYISSTIKPTGTSSKTLDVVKRIGDPAVSLTFDYEGTNFPGFETRLNVGVPSNSVNNFMNFLNESRDYIITVYGSHICMQESTGILYHSSAFTNGNLVRFPASGGAGITPNGNGNPLYFYITPYRENKAIYYHTHSDNKRYIFQHFDFRSNLTGNRPSFNYLIDFGNLTKKESDWQFAGYWNNWN